MTVAIASSGHSPKRREVVPDDGHALARVSSGVLPIALLAEPFLAHRFTHQRADTGRVRAAAHDGGNPRQDTSSAWRAGVLSHAVRLEPEQLRGVAAEDRH